MTDQELKDIVAAVVAELEKSGVDFDYKAKEAKDDDLVFVIRGTAPDYQGVTVTWKGLLDIITSQATQAKNDAVTAKNSANTILEQVKSNGTAISNFVATSKTDLENQKNESVNAVKSVYQTDLNELKGDLDNYTNTIYADLLKGLTKRDRWFINPSTGIGQSLGSFYSFENIDVSAYIEGTVLFPRSNYENGYNTARSIVYYDSDGNYIRGEGYSQSLSNNGLGVPANAKYVSVTFNIEATECHLFTNKEGKDSYYLNDQVLVHYEQIENKPIIPTKISELINDSGFGNKEVQRIRKPTICFIFDDGRTTDNQLVSLFDSYNWQCGFSLLSSIDSSRVSEYLDYQARGYEILSHSTNADGFTDESMTEEEAETKFKTSLETLKSYGFNVNGWVTPSTWILEKFMNGLKKYYQYGFGHLNGVAEGKIYHTFFNIDLRQIDRVSLSSSQTSLEILKTNVDNCILNNGFMCFYAHGYPTDTEAVYTPENFTALLDYIKTYEQNGEVQVLTPGLAINDYYAVRHSDLLELYNK